jgi:oligopeptide transport system substrate-binding protein
MTRSVLGKIPRTHFGFSRRRFSRATALPLLVACAWLLGCAPAERKADLVAINGIEPGTLDPALATSIEELRVVMSLFEGLTRNDPVTSQPIPGLADHWDISADGRIYTFHLRTNAFFSTGEQIGADDFVYSWRRVLSPATGSEYAGQLFYIKNAEAFVNGKIKDINQIGFRALDRFTFQVELNNPTAFFLDLCAFQTLAVVPRKAIEQHGDAWLRANPVPCSGPYRLETWRLNDKIRLEKNRHYWDAANTHCDVIDLLPVSTPNTSLNLYETGAADIIWDKDVVPNELLTALRQRPDCHHFNYLGTYFFRFNVTRPPFNDPRVRRALALAVDKKRLVEKITKGDETVAAHFVPDGTARYQPAHGLGYDPALARKLLAEAGYPDGKNFPVFQYLFDGAVKLHGQIAVELQQMWRKELGIQMELRQMEKKVYLAAQSALDYQLSRSSWIGDYNDPNTFLDLFISNNGNNRTGWTNFPYDALMREANGQPDLVTRTELLKKAETILVRDEVPIVPLYFYVGYNFYHPDRIAGIYPNILDLHPLNAITKKNLPREIRAHNDPAPRRTAEPVEKSF